MSQASQSAKSRTQDERSKGRSRAEWVTFGGAATILLAIVGLILYDWFIISPAPPVVTIARDGDIREVKSQFYVPFVVTNVGGSTAEAVQVIAELRIDSQVVEQGEQQIDFLSGSETQQGAFMFNHDPGDGELTMRVAGYKLP